MKFALDNKYTNNLDKQFCSVTYDELYKAFCKVYQCHGDGYYLFGEEEVIHTDLAIPTSLARPTLTTVLNPTTSNQDNS